MERMGDFTTADNARVMRETWPQIADNSANAVPTYSIGLRAGWNQISLGMSDPLQGSFTLDNPGAISAAWSYDSDTSQYVPETFALEAQGSNDDVSTMFRNLFKGMWVYSQVNQSLRIDGYSWYGQGITPPPMDIHDFLPQVRLNLGWNMLGVPAPDTIGIGTLELNGTPLSDVLAGGDTLPINKNLYLYDSATQQYSITSLSSASTLPGFRGYWLYTNVPGLTMRYRGAGLLGD